MERSHIRHPLILSLKTLMVSGDGVCGARGEEGVSISKMHFTSTNAETNLLSATVIDLRLTTSQALSVEAVCGAQCGQCLGYLAVSLAVAAMAGVAADSSE